MFAAVVEIVARIDERLAERVLVGRGGDGRQLRDDAMREDLAMARVMDVHRVVIERRHRRHHGRDHRHRVRVVVKAVEEAQQRLVDHRVMADAVGEFVQLPGARQIAVQQQVGDLHEGALLGQLLDRIAAIQQHAGVAVDVGDLAVARGGGRERRIVGENAVIAREIGDIEHVGADGSAAHRQRRGQAGFRVLEFEILAGHPRRSLNSNHRRTRRSARERYMVGARNQGAARRPQPCNDGAAARRVH